MTEKPDMQSRKSPITFGSRWGPEKHKKKELTIKPSVCRKQEVTYYDDTINTCSSLNKANALSEFEIEECKEAFSTFDTKGQGYISTDQLVHLLKMMGHRLAADDISKILNEVDEDGSGILKFREFLYIMATLSVDGEEDLREAFMLMDSENRGDIGGDELQQMMIRLGHALTEDELRGMIREADTTGNGRVSYDEFASMMKETC